MQIAEWLTDGKNKKWLLLAGVAVLVLFLLTTLFPEQKKVKTAEPVDAQQETLQYEEQLCERVRNLIERIEGVGALDVSVTLESSIEYVYVKEEKSDTDVRTGESESVTTRASHEEKLILVEDANGRKVALLQKTILPAVRGVVVVCEGGEDPLVVHAVTEAVKTALGIRSTQVFVTKRAQNAAR